MGIVCASYGQDLADALARDCRIIMASDWYRAVFPTRLARNALHDFATGQKVYRFATSVGGVLTGRGADAVIIDDPLKPDEALSDQRCNAVNAWFDNSLLSRLNSQATGRIIVVMQRLHMHDLVGHLLKKGRLCTLHTTPFEIERRGASESLPSESDNRRHIYLCVHEIVGAKQAHFTTNWIKS